MPAPRALWPRAAPAAQASHRTHATAARHPLSTIEHIAPPACQQHQRRKQQRAPLAWRGIMPAPSPLPPYSAFRRMHMKSTSTSCAGSSPPNQPASTAAAAPARLVRASARNYYTASVNTNAEHTVGQHQQRDRELCLRKQQLDQLRQAVARLEKEMDEDHSATAPKRNHVTPHNTAGIDSRVAESRPSPTSEALRLHVQQAMERPKSATPGNGTGSAASLNLRATQPAVPAVAPRSQCRRKSLQNAEAGCENQKERVSVALSTAASGGRGQLPRKSNRTRSRRSSMPCAVAFGRFA